MRCYFLKLHSNDKCIQLNYFLYLLLFFLNIREKKKLDDLNDKGKISRVRDEGEGISSFCFNVN